MDNNDFATVIVKLDDEDGGGFVSYVPDLPGCMADGETREEAAARIGEAIESWITVQVEDEQPVPAQGSAAREAVERERSMLSLIHTLTAEVTEKDQDISKLRSRVAHLLALLNDDARTPGLSALAKGSLKGPGSKRTH